MFGGLEGWRVGKNGGQKTEDGGLKAEDQKAGCLKEKNGGILAEDKKIEICFLTNKDVKGFLALLNNVWPLQHTFQKQWPHTSMPDQKKFKEHLLLKEGGFVAAHVGIYPQDMKVNGSILKSGSIGGVATHEKARGKGYMSVLLKRAVELLHERKYDVSWLGGDRKRYGYFGWECGGRVSKFITAPRYFSEYKTRAIKKFSGERVYLNQLTKLHSAEEFGQKRSRALDKLLYGRLKRDTWLALERDKVLAYMTLGTKHSDEQARVLECGGSLEELKPLIRHAFDKLGFKRLEAVTPSFPNRYKEFFNGFSWGDKSDDFYGDGCVKIINLSQTLKKFVKQMNLKAKSSVLSGRHSVTLVMEGTGESATIESAGKIVRITANPAKLKIVLNEQDMVKLLFPLSKPSEWMKLPAGAEFLDILFPLDFFFWPLETV